MEEGREKEGEGRRVRERDVGQKGEHDKNSDM